MAPKSAFSKPSRKSDDEFEFQLPNTIGGRGRIPKGDYIGRCVSIEADTSKTSGNPMWVWTFVITKGPHAGRDFKMWTVLTDDAAWKIVETLKALGVPAEPGDKIRIDKKKVIGVFCTLKIADDEYNGSETSKLQTVAAHSNGAGYKGGLKGKVEEEDDAEEDENEDDEEDAEEEDEVDEEPAPKARKPAPRGGKAAPVMKRRR